MAEQGRTQGQDYFKEEFKRYKRRFPATDLSEVIDLSRPELFGKEVKQGFECEAKKLLYSVVFVRYCQLELTEGSSLCCYNTQTSFRSSYIGPVAQQ